MPSRVSSTDNMKRLFLERLDFASSPGYLGGLGTRLFHNEAAETATLLIHVVR